MNAYDIVIIKSYTYQMMYYMVHQKAEKVIKVKSNNWNGKTPKHLRHGQSLAGNHTIVVTPLWK